MQKIVTCLWFENQAEEAARFYVSLFKNSKILTTSRLENAGPKEDQTVAVVNFELDGREFQAFNGGPYFKFNEAISILVNCESQQEVDRLWSALTADGGKESMCGWLKDKYGLSWQIQPTLLGKLMTDPNRKKANAVMHAMLQMRKIDSAQLQRAYDEA